jgi:hypothetical protein
MRYPKPQKGNPHKLTIGQNIFPKACISYFIGENGTSCPQAATSHQHASTPLLTPLLRSKFARRCHVVAL